MNVLASVVIPTFRRPELLEQCLRALARQTLALDRFEVIVCDDGADPQVRQRCGTLASELGLALQYLPITDTQGPAAARNRGWKAARGAAVAFTDDDCLPQPAWLEAGIAALAYADAVAGQVVVPLAKAPTDYERDTAGLAHSRFVTANCFCRRSALEAVGGFDEQFRLAWREDSDLECRLRAVGLRLARCSAAVVVHPVRRERFAISLRQQRKGQYDQLLRRRHPLLSREVISPYPGWYFAAVALLIASLATAFFGRYHLSAVAAGLWLMLTLAFTARRLRRNSKQPIHCLEMLVTSAAIPPLSVLHQVQGWWRFRQCGPFEHPGRGALES